MFALADVNGLSVPRAALAFVEAGVPIVPFDPTRGNGKECGNLVGNPRDPADRWYRHVTTDHAQIREWRKRFGRFAALATSPGAFGCVVIDLDHPQFWPAVWRRYLNAAPFVNTRSAVKRKGHYWFTAPPGAPAIGNRSFAWGEVRCVGGGVVLPPYRNRDTGDTRTVVRCGPLPALPAEIYAGIAGSGVVAADGLDLTEFCERYTANRYPGKLKGLVGLHSHYLAKTNAHDAMRDVLRIGLSEAVIGFVPASAVLHTLRALWPKERSGAEFDRLASWCAAVAEQSDRDETEAMSRRSAGTDSRRYAKVFVT